MGSERIMSKFRSQLPLKAIWITVLAGLTSVVLVMMTGERPLQAQHLCCYSDEIIRAPDANKRNEINQQNAQKADYEAVNAARRKQIADESTQLLKLATDLKTEVDKTDKDTLSVMVVRKAEAIEKLAHDVKEKMKVTVGAS